MAHAGAQQGLHAGTEGVQLFQGDKGLNRPGEAAAVDPDGPGSLQQLPAEGQGQGMACCRGSAVDQVF